MKKIIVSLMLVIIAVVFIATAVGCNEENSVRGETSGSHTSSSKEPVSSDTEKENSKVHTSTVPTYPLTSDSVEDGVSSEESSEAQESKPYYIVTAEEREMLATLVYLESSICSEDCQRAVASVIFNRLDSGRWKKDVNKDGKVTLYDIVYYPNAFSPSYLIENYKDKTTQECYDAVDYVIQNGPTVPTYVRYFRTKYHFKWDGYKGYCDMDNVYFGYMIDWQKGAW